MEPTEEVLDSPTGWVARHVHKYVKTDGRKGHEFWGSPSALWIAEYAGGCRPAPPLAPAELLALDTGCGRGNGLKGATSRSGGGARMARRQHGRSGSSRCPVMSS